MRLHVVRLVYLEITHHCVPLFAHDVDDALNAELTLRRRVLNWQTPMGFCTGMIMATSMSHPQ